MSAPRGAPDVLPPVSERHEMVQRRACELFRAWGFHRIETPAFEHTELFTRGLSEGSDIVTKEMYTFQDKGGRSLTLRPDMTAPVVRSVLEHGLADRGVPVKLYYEVPVFRHERPQAGRFRQFTQVGVEAIGSESPHLDADVIALAIEVFKACELQSFELALNTIGHVACRSDYMPKLVAFLRAHEDELCEDCRRKIDRNPLRTFDCKVASDIALMDGAPMISDHVCDDCRAHHEKVKEGLSQLGVAFRDAPRLVRGLDYYSRTTFEFTAAGLGSQDAIGGGGRYDGLAEMLGGPRLPGIGFGLGVARMVMALGEPEPSRLDVYVVTMSDTSVAGLELAQRLRRSGLRVDIDLEGRSMKAQMKAADRSGAKKVLVVGEKELAGGTVTVKDMESGSQVSVAMDDPKRLREEIG